MAWDREQKLALYSELVAGETDLKLKGKASKYTAMNGNMFSFLAPDGTLAFRLAKQRRAAFLEQHPDSVVIQYNTVMKDYIGIPDSLLEDRAALTAMWAEVIANARTLKPKPTKKPKKASQKKASPKKS